MPELDDAQPEGGLPDWIRDPVGVMRRRWRAALAAFVLGVVATLGVAAMRKPTYVAKASVLLAEQKLADSLVKPTSQSSPVDAVDAFAAEALSVANLKKVIDDVGLYPDLREKMSADELVATMRDSIKVDPTTPGTPRPPPGVRMGDRSRVMRIGFESTDPDVAAKVANQLAMLFQTEGLRMRGEQARLTSEFMRREVESAEKALKEQKARIAEFEEKHRGELPSDLETNRRRIERLQDQRDQLVTAAAEAETRLAKEVAAPASGQGSAESKLAEARAALAAARSVNTETHPNVIALRRQVAALEKELGGGGGSGAVAAAARREVAQYRQQIADTDAELDALDARTARIPTNEAEIGSLQQRAKALEETYFDVLQKLQEAELAESLELSQQGAQVAVLEQAVPPLAPEKGRLKIVLAGLLASGGLGVLVALLLELRDPVIATAQGVEAIAGVPVLGVMPRVS